MKIYECCGLESISQKKFCPKCGNDTFIQKDVSDKGTVYSFTVIHIAPTEFSHLAPYSVVLVQLDESSAKVTVRMTEPVEIGDAVVLKQMEDDAFIYEKIII